jgi:uncharacterized membrane protein (DUF4010 family)
MTEHIITRLAVALGVGLLIGAERERRKGTGPLRAPAGIRTFALVSLVGGLSLTVGGEILLAVASLAVAGLGIFAYRARVRRDPGLTTVIALFVTLLLGALAMREPGIAAGVAVVVAILLAARTRIHTFVQEYLSEQELQDALLFAAAALVILPLTPDHPVGPLGVLNARTLWKLVVIVMGIGAAGYVSLRALGPRYGLPLVGFVSGFISSAATIGSMGAKAAKSRAVLDAAVAGAVLSTVATVGQMAAVLWITDRATFLAFGVPLALGGAAAVGYGVFFMLLNKNGDAPDGENRGRAFNLGGALIFAATVSVAMLGSALVNRWLGSAGLIVAAGLAGFADTHSAAISVASLAAAGKITAREAVLPILAAMSTNTLTKMVVAVTAGGKTFSIRVIPGLLLVLFGLWIGALVLS